MVLNIVDKIISKSAFPKVRFYKNELMKLGIIRLVLGFILLVRFTEISLSINLLYPAFGNSILILFFFTLSFAFFIGFVTPISSFLVLIFAAYIDIKFHTRTLGTALLQITILPLFLINCGNYYSLDRYLSQRSRIFSIFISSIYRFIGAKKNEDITRAYFLSFLIYFAISFAALSFHLQDEYWMNGLTTRVLVLNSFLSKYYYYFRTIDMHYPIIMTIFSITASILQSIFQFLMLPLIFFKWGQKFVFYWGMIFFIICLFCINLSYLPHIEILLWIMIFKPINILSKPIKIFYDDYCNLCKKTMMFFKQINYNERIKFLPISKNKKMIEGLGISEKQIRSYMAGSLDGKIILGYDIYLALGKKNLLLFPFLPILFLGKISNLGPLVYDFIAKNRYKYFGQCTLSFHDEIAKKIKPIKKPDSSFINNLTFHLFLVLMILYLLLNPNFLLIENEFVKKFNKKIRLIGFDLPNVFNKTDLEMGDKWMEISRIENDGIFIVPIIGSEGNRLNYQDYDILNFTNHNSDVLYYGTTLKFRRYIIGEDIDNFMGPDQFGWKNLKKRINYDYRKNKFNGLKKYLVEIYSNSSSKVKHWYHDQTIYEKKLEYSCIVSFDHKSELLNILNK